MYCTSDPLTIVDIIRIDKGEAIVAAAGWSAAHRFVATMRTVNTEHRALHA